MRIYFLLIFYLKNFIDCKEAETKKKNITSRNYVLK